MNSKLEQLEYAKNAVKWLVDHPNRTVDFNSLVYWAKRVEELRKELLKIWL